MGAARRPRAYHARVWLTGPQTALREALELERHENMVEAAILAPTKAAAAAATPDLRGYDREGWRLSGSYRSVLALDEVGLLGPSPVLFNRAAKDNPIVRLHADGTIERVATWRYESGFRGRGLYVEVP